MRRVAVETLHGWAHVSETQRQMCSISKSVNEQRTNCRQQKHQKTVKISMKEMLGWPWRCGKQGPLLRPARARPPASAMHMWTERCSAVLEGLSGSAKTSWAAKQAAPCKKQNSNSSCAQLQVAAAASKHSSIKYGFSRNRKHPAAEVPARQHKLQQQRNSSKYRMHRHDSWHWPNLPAPM
jgi:hypothetical protein